VLFDLTRYNWNMYAFKFSVIHVRAYVSTSVTVFFLLFDFVNLIDSFSDKLVSQSIDLTSKMNPKLKQLLKLQLFFDPN